MAKDNSNKSRRTKTSYVNSAKEIGIVCSCSESYVKKIRASVQNIKIGKLPTVSLDTHKAMLVIMVDEQTYNANTKLLKEIEKIIE